MWSTAVNPRAGESNFIVKVTTFKVMFESKPAINMCGGRNKLFFNSLTFKALQ